MLLDELADYLSTQGFGTVGTDLFKSRLPDVPNFATAIYETGGRAAVHAMAASPGQAREENPRVQVVVRSTDYAVARARADAIWKKLDGLGDVTLNGVAYKWVAAVQSPFPMGGPDEVERVHIVCNYDVAKALS